MSADPPARVDAERSERACLVALASVGGIGPATLLACLTTVGAPEAWAAVRAGASLEIGPLADAARRLDAATGARQLAAAAARLDPESVLARHEAAGQQVVVFGRRGYPARLEGDPSPPAVLFAEGSLEALTGPTVAVVGTRNATRLGCDTASLLAIGLVDAGVSVVSGLALGIDGAAHQAVIEATAGAGDDGIGRPIGVVASGLDRPYPRRHQLLHRQVTARGAVLTETPIGTAPLPWRFPARNRIIAGISDAVIVVESRSAGGSMLTAAEALARDVPVLAVPGHPTAAASAGALDLIFDGAAPVRDVDDVLVAIGRGGQKLGRRDPPPSGGAAESVLTAEATRVLDDLTANPRTLGELVASRAADLEVVAGALVELEQRGLVARSGPWFERIGPSGRPGQQGSRP
ncbi:DNA-processing protein DprA [Aquihabitans sp. McL0605]|uniref:DNA-processing protein DprA n=1 Tax=Aquihabitans sp. McL0605 TaxID=3415671 RepID=UPI003CE8A768